MKKTLCSMLTLVLLLVMAQSAFALNYTVYTDRAAWESALLNGSFSESFDDADLHPYLDINSTWGSAGVGDGVWHDQADDRYGYETTIAFTMPVYGIAGDFDLAGPGGEGGGLSLDFSFYFPGLTSLKLTLPGSTSGFWGVVMDNLFTSVLLSDETSGYHESFDIDNLSWAHVPGTPAPTPIPGAVWLLGSGLFGLVGVRRKMKA